MKTLLLLAQLRPRPRHVVDGWPRSHLPRFKVCGGDTRDPAISHDCRPGCPNCGKDHAADDPVCETRRHADQALRNAAYLKGLPIREAARGTTHTNQPDSQRTPLKNSATPPTTLPPKTRQHHLQDRVTSAPVAVPSTRAAPGAAAAAHLLKPRTPAPALASAGRFNYWSVSHPLLPPITLCQLIQHNSNTYMQAPDKTTPSLPQPPSQPPYSNTSSLSPQPPTHNLDPLQQRHRIISTPFLP